MIKAYSYIRMSTDAQLRGDSLRRQIERTQQFVDRKGLVLDDEFKLRDIGLSGFDGSNLEKGMLGMFLHAVRAGKIPKGAYLILESLDRLSRQSPRLALPIFLELLNSGIYIATMIDERVYAPESHDPIELLTSILFMSRAHDESLHKSVRVGAAWKNKRDRGSSSVLTRRCKAWVQVSADGTEMEAIPHRADIVRRIFFEAVDFGMGADAIARRFNREGVPPFGNSTGWHKSYVGRILKDRSVLGEFQPHTKEKRRRLPAGDPWPDYYPRVVSEEYFYRAQACLSSRRIAGGGRKGDRVANLFSKVARCGSCGSTMNYINKGAKGRPGLVCSRARRGMDCSAGRWNYSDFELSALTLIQEIDLVTVTRDRYDADRERTHASRASEIEGRIIEAKAQRDRVFELAIRNESSDFLASRLREYDATVVRLESDLDAAYAAIETARVTANALDVGAELLGALVKRLQTELSPDVLRIRTAIAAKVKDVIEEIIVWPKGISAASSGGGEEGRRFRLTFQEYWAEPRHDSQAFFVKFKNGAFRFVHPARDNPAIALAIYGLDSGPLPERDGRLTQRRPTAHAA